MNEVKSLLIKGARIIDPSQNMDMIGDILTENGLVSRIAPEIDARCEILDASGLVLSPGLVDMHVHTRDPGFTHKEDLASAAASAAAGGVTSILTMPNTSPPIDCGTVITDILMRSRGLAAKIYVTGAITTGQKGLELTDFEELKQSGAVAVSDDGRPVESTPLMSEAMKKAYENGLCIISHCEDLIIIDGGIINDGKISETLRVKGMSRQSEDSVTQRETDLAERLGVPIHIAHVSTRGSVDIVRKAKSRGVKVTCETAPHYFVFTDDMLLGRDADYRMNPPLRTNDDRLAVIEGLKDGTIDAIATDHAPHAPDEKSDFLNAPNGVIGLETSLAAGITYLVAEGHLTLGELITKMSFSPAGILGLNAGSLKSGVPADMVIFDPDERWTVDTVNLKSKSKNTPFKGMTLKGKVKYTVLDGKAF